MVAVTPDDDRSRNTVSMPDTVTELAQILEVLLLVIVSTLVLAQLFAGVRSTVVAIPVRNEPLP